MIQQDQPTCFSGRVVARVSSREDGTMLDRTCGNRHEPAVVENRRRFCEQAGIDYDRCVYQIITYEPGTSYDAIADVDTPNTDGIIADVLYTETPGLGLFLPIADCAGTVIYDQARQALALAHLGRHASIADTVTKTIHHFVAKGSNLKDLVMWMAPSVKQPQYRMEYFDAKDDERWKTFVQTTEKGVFLDLQGYNKARAEAAGVRPENIHISLVNTAIDPHYFSHSQGDTAGRFAVLAFLR